MSSYPNPYSKIKHQPLSKYTSLLRKKIKNLEPKSLTTQVSFSLATLEESASHSLYHPHSQSYLFFLSPCLRDQRQQHQPVLVHSKPFWKAGWSGKNTTSMSSSQLSNTATTCKRRTSKNWFHVSSLITKNTSKPNQEWLKGMSSLFTLPHGSLRLSELSSGSPGLNQGSFSKSSPTRSLTCPRTKHRE